jgi:hypothetical protein
MPETMTFTIEETGTLAIALADAIAVTEKILIPGGYGEKGHNDNVAQLLRRFCADEETAQMLIDASRHNLAESLHSPEVARTLNQEATQAMLRH